jgi:hypothetical protein
MEVTEITVTRLLCCGFRGAGKVMGQLYQCWRRICLEINVFSRFEYRMFYVLYPFVTCLLTLPHIMTVSNENLYVVLAATSSSYFRV